MDRIGGAGKANFTRPVLISPATAAVIIPPKTGAVVVEIGDHQIIARRIVLQLKIKNSFRLLKLKVAG